ncbi:MAG: hypothetical protein KatS3mg087_1055 [Patescibacteria group bacterium]|nr:MAG: hypothetical protein KatS3mg087_1055 [Patescibacteria group bacterium]
MPERHLYVNARALSALQGIPRRDISKPMKDKLTIGSSFADIDGFDQNIGLSIGTKLCSARSRKMIAREVRGLKLLKVDRLPPPMETLTLASPISKSRWEPRTPPQYRAQNGIYFWALPASLLESWQHIRPFNSEHVVVFVRTVIARNGQGVIEPVHLPIAPRQVDWSDKDVQSFSSYMAIAQAVEIERFILHPESPQEGTRTLSAVQCASTCVAVRCDPCLRWSYRRDQLDAERVAV